jgi:hypothetical protein
MAFISENAKSFINNYIIKEPKPYNLSSMEEWDYVLKRQGVGLRKTAQGQSDKGANTGIRKRRLISSDDNYGFEVSLQALTDRKI